MSEPTDALAKVFGRKDVIDSLELDLPLDLLEELQEQAIRLGLTLNELCGMILSDIMLSQQKDPTYIARLLKQSNT